MNDDKFAPVNNTDAVSAEDLLAQADALLSVEETPAADVFAPQEAASEASAPAAQTPSQTTYPYPPDQNSVPAQYAAPEGYELRYVQTPQGYQPVYMPIAQPVYPPEYSQLYQPMYAPQSPQPAADQRKARRSAPQSRPAGALRERPRKKPWGKILGATVLSAAIVALVVWGVVAGAAALIRSFGRDRNSSMDGYYDDGYYGGNSWNGMGGYGDDVYYIDQDGNLVDGNGNIIGNVHDGGYFQDEGGNTVIISPIGPNGSPDNSSEYVEGDASYYFVHAGSGLNLRDEPDGSRIANIPNGYPVRVLGWKGEWAYVAYDSSNDTSLGWVNGSYLSGDPAINPTKYYVHADGGLNMRSQPSTSGSRILTIPEGEVVYSQAYCDDWVFVSYNGWYGWVSGDYISTSASKPAKPQQGNQGNPGSSGGYTTADIEAAIAEAKEYYRSRKGKAPNSGLRGDSLTDEQVEELYWKAVGLVVGMDYFPAGQFETIVGSLEVKDDPYAWFYQVSDPKIKSMEDWADLFYSSLTDDLACDILCGAPMFMLDGKMYIPGGAMGDEGLGTEYTIRIEKESSGYKLIMDVVNTREDDYTGTVERMQWSFTAHCFKEDGVWVFDDADTPYR